MRYRRVSYRHATITHEISTWTLAPRWPGHVLAFLVGRPCWRPDADMREVGRTIEILVDLAGVDEDDVEIQLFDDALVVEGERRLPTSEDATVYHIAGVRQGPFRLELPLVAPVDPDAVDARYERGLLRITLRKLEAER